MASCALMPFWAMPTMKPPTRFTSTMTMAAIASPLTNFDAPSIAP